MFDERGRDAVEELHRGTEGDISFFDTAFEDGLIGVLEDVEPEATAREEGDKEGDEPFKGELLTERDELAIGVRREFIDDFLNEFIALTEGIGREVGQFDASSTFVVEGAATTPGEVRFFSFEACFDAIDTAFVPGPATTFTSLANEGIFFDDLGG